MTQDLYTQADIKRIRQLLYEEQQGLCALTKLPVEFSSTHTDYAHDSEQLVRGVLHRAANMSLGKIENIAVRYLYWYPYTLPEFLRQVADYLEKEKDTRYRHVDWQKRVRVMYNKLNAQQQNKVLTVLGSIEGGNVKSRKELFAKVVLDRNLGYNVIVETIEKENKYGLV